MFTNNSLVFLRVSPGPADSNTVWPKQNNEIIELKRFRRTASDPQLR